MLRIEGDVDCVARSEAPWSLQKALVGLRKLSRGSPGRRLTPGPHVAAGWSGVAGGRCAPASPPAVHRLLCAGAARGHPLKLNCIFFPPRK